MVAENNGSGYGGRGISPADLFLEGTMGESIFSRHYHDYLAKLATLDLPARADRLGAEVEGNGLRLRLLGRDYLLSSREVVGEDGNRAPYDACIILYRYVLMCPTDVPAGDELVTFRNLKDSGPLTVYFADNVERFIAERFSGRLEDFRRICGEWGEDAGITANVDAAVRFAALPKIPLVVLFNDRDEDFPASCSLLMERRAESYLDAECLAMLGHGLARRLAG
jgi:Domain of unknown function (DUF3786)